MLFEVQIDAAALRNDFRLSNLAASQNAVWRVDDPALPPDTCRYCGRPWRRWAGSKLDGHAACIVTEDFKRRLVLLLRSSPQVTYAVIAEVLGVSPSVVRSWTYPIRAGS